MDRKKNDNELKVSSKNYLEELAAWVKKREVSRQRRDKNLVTVLALRADMKAAIGAGYTVKTIWEHLHETEKISCCYETFLKHIRQHITQVKESNPEQKAGVVTKPQAPTPLPGFTFNPIPKKEDLF
ncbi:MAG: hypothetical protein BGO67_00555 [Alphaproteobacteria bacterium 41-28]|nr:MAG: hypothetical protein BGO67_00555 [Alphaproteobacteria bacterium 41-28]